MKIISSILFTILVAIGFAQPTLIEKVAREEGTINIAYEKWKLPNGLVVILHEDHSDPMVHVQVMYNVGSAREKQGRSGFAHFFEHMMFQGSEHVEDEEHFKVLSEAGASFINGFTTADNTVYLETVPANQLELALFLESDRMGYMLEALTEKKFENQRDAVKNEKKQNYINRPYGLSGEKAAQMLYPPSHPYNWPVIGYVEDLDAATLNDVKEFFMRWYGPNNASITLAGDIKPKEALALVEKYFGGIKPGPIVKRQKFERVILPEDLYVSYKDNIYAPLTMMSFPTVPNYHRDEAPLDILSSILGGGKSSIFYKKFVKSKLAFQAGVSHPCKELAGEFQIQVVSPPLTSLNDIEAEIRKTLSEADKEITEDNVERAKLAFTTSFLRGYESVQDKAKALNTWHHKVPRKYNAQDDYNRYNRVTKEDVIRVFLKYIKNKPAEILTVTNRMPNEKPVESTNPFKSSTVDNKSILSDLDWKYEKPTEIVNRDIIPVSTVSITPKVPNYYTFTLGNDIKAIGTFTNEIPEVIINIIMEGGDLVFNNDLKKANIAQLTAAMMNEGTMTKTAEEIGDKLERLGSTINFRGGTTGTTIAVSALKSNLDATLKILEDKLFHPKFEQEDFDRNIKNMKAALSSAKKDANSMASTATSSILYGDTYFGYQVTDKHLDKLTLEDVKNYYDKYYGSDKMSISVVGDIKQEDIANKLTFLTKLEKKNYTISKVPDFPPNSERVINLVHKPYTEHSVISISQMAIPYDATGDYFKARIFNFALGGAFNSRLNLKLREEKGYTYGINSGFAGSEYKGPFYISSSVKAEKTDSAIIIIMDVLNDFLKKGITKEELEFTKKSFLNKDALKYETNSAKAGFLYLIQKYNLPKDLTEQQTKILNDITIEELNTLAKKLIDPEKLQIVVVGNKFTLKKELDALDLGKVVEFKLD